MFPKGLDGMEDGRRRGFEYERVPEGKAPGYQGWLLSELFLQEAYVPNKISAKTRYFWYNNTNFTPFGHISNLIWSIFKLI